MLWLDGVEKKYVEEVGSMNIMFKIDGKGQATMSWFIHRFKPFIDHNFRTLPDLSLIHIYYIGRCIALQSVPFFASGEQG